MTRPMARRLFPRLAILCVPAALGLPGLAGGVAGAAGGLAGCSGDGAPVGGGNGLGSPSPGGSSDSGAMTPNGNSDAGGTPTNDAAPPPDRDPDAGGSDSAPTPPPSAPDAGTDAADAAVSPRDQLIGFLQSIQGKQTVSGEHNREASEGDFIQAMDDVTGHYPALWGGDFLYESDAIQNRPNVISHLMDGWKGGSIISLMYHACPPNQGEACDWDGGVLSALSDADWSDLTTDGGTLNQAWKSRLDAIAPYFQQLKDAGMAALFRPHHEMNQGVFWWAGRKGPAGTAKLYQTTHDYLVKTKGLDNIVWVWSVQDIWDSSTNSWNFDAYNPGDAYWDVMSLDFYDGKGYTADKYAAMLAEAGSKPIAIGECQVLPTAAELTAQPKWVYFMGWAELVQQNDSNAVITSLYTAPNVLTQDRMPGW
jgi:mannan endo-1,4-beta-mannosidase